MTNHVLRSGERLALGRKIGHGGEGAVFEINGRQALVAKIYDKPLDPKHAEKLEAICALRTDKLSSVCAWPIEVIYTNGKACGFVMPLIAKTTEIHELFGSAGRKRVFPDADWAFLIHVAENLSAAVHNLHAANIVVGDFNQRNIVVTREGMVKFWDCDSFQIERSGRTYYCTVGVPEFTAPELQSCTSFDGVKRSFNHDCFALAVMNFYLLFLGRHPFAGDPTDPNVTSFELPDAIASRMFAYSSNAPAFGVRPPRISPPVRELGSDLLPLFRGAFEKSERPTAADWHSALKKVKSQLTRCSVNPGHVFPQRLTRCPWCDYDTKWSLTTFLPTACPPRFIKPFDYAGIIAGVKHCFSDFSVGVPPEVSSFVTSPLPPVCTIPSVVETAFKSAKERVSHWTSEIVKLNELLQPDAQIGEITKRGQASYREHKSLKDKSATLLKQKGDADSLLEQLQAKVATLAQRQPIRQLSVATVIGAIVCGLILSVSLPIPLGLGSGFATSATIFVILHGSRRMRLKAAKRSLGLATAKAKQFASESEKVVARVTTLESELHELAEVLKSLQNSQNERSSRVSSLVEEAERSLQLAQADMLSKQAVYDEAREKFEKSMEARRQEHALRCSKLRALEGQRIQASNRLNEMYCPAPLREARQQFGVAKSSYDRIQDQLEKEIETIRRSSRERQMKQHLENFSIEKLRPGGLGRNLLVNLKSHGIETAADVSHKAVFRVRGFGEVRTQMLVSWRNQCEAKFIYDASRQLTQQDLDGARLKFTGEFHKAEAFLKRSSEHLLLTYQKTKQQVFTLERELAAINEKLGQTRADASEKP